MPKKSRNREKSLKQNDRDVASMRWTCELWEWRLLLLLLRECVRAQCWLVAAITSGFPLVFQDKNTHKPQLIKQIACSMGHSYCKVLL